MSAPPELPPVVRLMNMIFGYSLSCSISAAATLGVADHIGDEPVDVSVIAKNVGAQAEPLQRLLRALGSAGVFVETSPGKWSHSALSLPLRTDAPDSVRRYSMMTAAPWFFNVWSELPATVRSGTPAFEEMFGKSFFSYLAEHPEAGALFNDGMSSTSKAEAMAIARAYDFSKHQTIVDVGGGHGTLLAEVLEQAPTSRGVLFDIDEVIAGAKSGPLASVAARVTYQSGDFFASVPKGGDAYLLKYIIHDWDDEKAAQILSRCREVLPPDGRLLIAEMFIPEGNTPALGKFLDLVMLLFLHGKERTQAEYVRLLERAGLRLVALHQTGSPMCLLECAAL